jgi:hypothetical protein
VGDSACSRGAAAVAAKWTLTRPIPGIAMAHVPAYIIAQVDETLWALRTCTLVTSLLLHDEDEMAAVRPEERCIGSGPSVAISK